MKKQREIQHALQKRLSQSEINEKNLQDSLKEMDEDYSGQVHNLKFALQEKIEIITRLGDELEKDYWV